MNECLDERETGDAFENCKRVKDPERCFQTQECDDWMAWFRAEWEEIRAAAYSSRRGAERKEVRDGGAEG